MPKHLYKSFVRLLLVTGLSTWILGCQPKDKSAAGPYRTLGRDLKRDTEKAKELNAKAVALVRDSKYDQAEPILKQALEADVTFGPAHNNLGKVYFQKGQMYLAAWEFQYASNLMTDHPEPRNNLGLVFESVGKLDEAITWYDAALKEGPENAQYLGNAARARIVRGDKGPEVRELLEKLVMRDDRSDWNEWARETLARMPSNNAAPTTTP